MSKTTGHPQSQDNFPNDPVKDASLPLAIALQLDDLVPNSTGAVVIQGGNERLEIILEEANDLLARGIAADGTVSEHFDVSGYDYITFANGISLYYPAGEVTVTCKPPAKRETKTPLQNFTLTELLDREFRQDRRIKPARPA